MENVTIFDHPLIQHKISMLRDKRTGTNEFRALTEEIAMLMGLRGRSATFRWRTWRWRLPSRPA